MAASDGDEYEFLFKAILTGDSAVGKSNLMSRIAKKEFTPNSKPTVGVEFATRTVVIQGRHIKAQLWDTAGQERYRAITSSSSYYRGALGAFLVYDITQRSTFDSLKKWLEELRENGDPEMVGNKSDLNQQRQVDVEHNVNVEEAFMEMINRIHTITRQKQLASKSFKAMHSLLQSRWEGDCSQVTPINQSKCCTN